MAKRALALSMLLPALLMSAGCVRIGAKPPRTLLTVASTTPAGAGEAVTVTAAGSILLGDFGAARAIAPARVAVRAGDNSIAYVKDAMWVDTPRNLFRSLLAEALASRGGLVVVDPSGYGISPARRLGGRLTEFTIDARSKTAVVAFDADLLAPDGTVKARRFTASAPVQRIDASHVAAPLQDAANQVAEQIADWVKAN